MRTKPFSALTVDSSSLSRLENRSFILPAVFRMSLSAVPIAAEAEKLREVAIAVDMGAATTGRHGRCTR